MKIGLALSGGGALGVAHIGAIEEIEKAGIKIDCVCGVSSGAIIGLAYSAGGLETLHKFYEDALVGLAKKDKLIFAKGPNAVFKYIGLELKSLCRGKDFSALAVQFSCSAIDLATGEREVFRVGDPVMSVMASSAYPGVFEPQKFNGKFYIDGGVTRNLPVEEVRTLGADFVISSSSYAIDRIANEKAGRLSRLETAARALDILEKELSRFEEKQGDFCFKPPVAQFRWFDFFKMEEILEQGRANAAKQIPQLLAAINRT